MKNILSAVLLFATLFVAAAPPSAAAEGRSLMEMIAEWHYPKSAINGAEMADGMTINANGDRTIQSLVCRTVMTTDAPVAKVVAYYKTKLKPKAISDDKVNENKTTPGRSVTFHDDSEGRPFSVHVIAVNTKLASTTLVITRGQHESKTHIAWKHYTRL